MGEIFYSFCRFIQETWSFSTFLEDYLPSEFLPVSIAIVFAIAFVLVRTLNTVFIAHRSNENYSAYTMYKTPATACIIRAITFLYILYMIPWLIYMVVEPLSLATESEIRSNMLFVVIMCASVLVVLYTMITTPNLRFLSQIYMSGKSVVCTYLLVAAAILFCKMFSGLYFENSDSLNIPSLVAILGFSGLAIVLQNHVVEFTEKTFEYFKTKDEFDTFVTQKLDDETIAEIKRCIPLVSDDESAEKLSAKEQMQDRFRSTRAIIPIDNNDFCDNMNQARTIVHPGSCSENYDYELGSSLNKEPDDSNYSVNHYKPEAIAKIFDALGYNCEPTAENYVKLRRTVDFLKSVYKSERDCQYSLYSNEIEKQYSIIAPGVSGEKFVAKILENMEEKYSDMEVLQNFRFYYGDSSSAECDLLILTNGGIFCVEVKNYGQDANYTLEISANGTWYKKYGNQLHQMDQDPFRQNHMHAEALVQRFKEEFLKLTGGEAMPSIYELVVVPNDIMINNNSLNRVLHVGGLFEFIRTEAEKYDKNTVLEIAENLKKCALAPIKYDQVDFTKWAQDLNDMLRSYKKYEKIANEIRLSEKYRII